MVGPEGPQLGMLVSCAPSKAGKQSGHFHGHPGHYIIYHFTGILLRAKEGTINHYTRQQTDPETTRSKLEFMVTL